MCSWVYTYMYDAIPKLLPEILKMSNFSQYSLSKESKLKKKLRRRFIEITTVNRPVVRCVLIEVLVVILMWNDQIEHNYKFSLS